MSTETELKLEIDVAAMRRLRRHAALKELKRAQPRTRFQKSVYFDTPDFHLRDNEVVLRVRHIGRRRIQTLKTMGECLGGAWAVPGRGANGKLRSAATCRKPDICKPPS